MNIVVCAKQIQDPEIPPSKFRIDPEKCQVLPPLGVPPVINPFDEQAVEVALRLKEKQGGKITAITLGRGTARDVLKHSLSMGADEAIILEDEAFNGSDSFAKAYILSRAIQKIGSCDLVLCGRQAADWDEGQVGAIVAELLGFPIISLVRKVEVVKDRPFDSAQGRVRAERVLLDGYEVVEAALPAVVTVSNEVGQPRLPSGFGIIAAARKKIACWGASDLGIEPSAVGTAAAFTRVTRLYIPSRHGECQIMSGRDAAEAAVNLALKLREAKII